MPTAQLDPVALAQALIRCPSVTPIDAGALDVLQDALEGLGFRCRRMVFEEAGTEPVDNLYARLGNGGRNLCFAGHTDVVPTGDKAAWSVDPFAATLSEGWLIGRGAADMKAAIACWTAAVAGFLSRRGPQFGGSLSLLITGDEEAASINGTRKVLKQLLNEGEKLDACVVGEPTSVERVGDMVKIGRRGSLSGEIVVEGVQGHTAYPHLADNPAHRLVRLLTLMTEEPLDRGSAHFQPSTLQITSIDIGNPASNVIPRQAKARFNVRFNDLHSGAGIERWVRERMARVGGKIELSVRISGESFLTAPGPLSALVERAVKAETNAETELGTTGGTSDARFIKDFCPVVELGLQNDTAHKVDERVRVSDIALLARIYGRILDGYFAAA
ncbi:MAG TPA: succinyl-diaminopimelate desuccinylase [Kiloniellales bacterium]|nr:succinyl-diaminopimelate desuccinylase [Kiloniellales bacterium]